MNINKAKQYLNEWTNPKTGELYHDADTESLKLLQDACEEIERLKSILSELYSLNMPWPDGVESPFFDFFQQISEVLKEKEGD